MRLVDEDFPQAQSLPEQVKAVTARLSADYIIHDLQTGNFVTVLRFISRLTLQSGVSETRFYQILAGVYGVIWRRTRIWQSASPNSICSSRRLFA
jgi:aerobactin synthase